MLHDGVASVRDEGKPDSHFSGLPSLVNQGAGVEVTKTTLNSSKPLLAFGRTDRSYFIFCNKETWVLGEQYVILTDKPNLAGIISPTSECSPPTPAWGWKVIHKRQVVRPLRRPRSGRTEVGSPALAAPARGPASGSGAQSPRAPQTLKAKFLKAVAPTLQARAESGQAPRASPKRDFGAGGVRLVLQLQLQLARGSLPGERSSLSGPPQTSALGEGGKGPQGASPDGAG